MSVPKIVGYSGGVALIVIVGFVILSRVKRLTQCRSGYKSVAGVCWQECPSDSVNVGALCRSRCRAGYKDVSGVCWFDKCPPGQKKSGARCYQPCRTNEKEVGCCLCREKCRSGYREVLGVCWKGLKSYVPKTRPRTSDGKQASYVPKTFAKKSYLNTLGTIGVIVFPFVVIMLLLVAARVVLKLKTGV